MVDSKSLCYSFAIQQPSKKSALLTKNISADLFLEVMRIFPLFFKVMRIYIYNVSQNSLNCCLYKPAPPLAGWRNVACTFTP